MTKPHFIPRTSGPPPDAATTGITLEIETLYRGVAQSGGVSLAPRAREIAAMAASVS
jgi:hypothetical protein